MRKISNPRPIKNSLNLVEQSFQDLQEVVRKHRGKSMTEDCEEARELERYYGQFEDNLVSLVHEQTVQLYHPYVRHYLLSWPANKDFLRKLHRGLEKGVKRQLKESDLPLLVAIWEGQEKGWSLRRIQQSLENNGLIPRISCQAFYKRVKRLFALTGCAGPFYDELALSGKPEPLPDFVKEAWSKAEANLKELQNSISDHQLAIDEQVRRELEIEAK